MTGTTEAAPAPPPSPETGEPRRRRFAAVAFPVAVVSIIVITIGACLALTHDDGATTPEAALHDLLDAIESADALAVLDALPPAERNAVIDGLPELASQLADLGLIDTGAGSMPAIPVLTVENLRVSTTPFGDDVAAVDLIGGDLQVRIGPGGGGLLTEAGRDLFVATDDAPDADATISRDLAQDPVRLVAIREGGGWHISIAYSIVDALVADGGVAVPAMGEGPFPYGAATAEAAVTDFIQAYADGYLDRLITVLSSDEARSLYDYAPVILPGTAQLVEDLLLTGAYDVQLNSITAKAAGSGGTRTVTVTGLDLDIRDQVHKVHVVLEDGCLHVDERIDDDDAPFAVYDVCAGEWDDPDATRRPLDNPVGNAAVFGGGAELPTFTVVERNGRWFISPIRTFFDATTATLERLGPDEQRAFLERLVRSIRAGVGDGLIGDPVPPDLTPDERAAVLIARCDALVPDDPDGAPDGTDDDPGAATTTSGTRQEAVRRECVDRLVRTGSIDWDAIPPDRRAGLTPPPAA